MNKDKDVSVDEVAGGKLCKIWGWKLKKSFLISLIHDSDKGHDIYVTLNRISFGHTQTCIYNQISKTPSIIHSTD